MAIILSEISTQFSAINVDVVAGRAGMRTPVTWVHVVEGVEIAPFLDPGELAFMTGLALKTQGDLLTLVQEIHRHGASGLIVNLGPFIQEVPLAVLAFADAVDFPLMIAPWQVRLSEIMRVLTLEITALNLRDMELEVAMKRAILSPELAQSSLSQLQNQTIDQEGSFACVVASFFQGDAPVSQERLEVLKTNLQTHLHYTYKHITPLTIYHHVVLVVPTPRRNYLEELLDFCQKKVPLFPGETINCCVGNTVQGIEKLHESFEKASKLLMKKFRETGNVFFYDDMGLYALLAEVESADTLRTFYQQHLAPLVNHDKSHDGDLLEILRLYLHHNGSVKAVAEMTFLHRNTVNYKLGKIAELLNVNLSDLQCRVHLTIALAIHDILS